MAILGRELLILGQTTGDILIGNFHSSTLSQLGNFPALHNKACFVIQTTSLKASQPSLRQIYFVMKAPNCLQPWIWTFRASWHHLLGSQPRDIILSEHFPYYLLTTFTCCWHTQKTWKRQAPFNTNRPGIPWIINRIQIFAKRILRHVPFEFEWQ